MPNIEMKSMYGDLEFARKKVQELGGQFLWKDTQVDTYYFTKNGKLKLRQSEKNGSELLPYLKVDDGVLKRSDYVRLPTTEPELLASLLDQLLGRQLRVRKIREVYLIENVRVHLDQVEDLGSFLEFEAVYEDDTNETREKESKKVASLMTEFKVNPDLIFSGSYPDLIQNNFHINPSEKFFQV